jgi:hypothetical protein
MASLRACGRGLTSFASAVGRSWSLLLSALRPFPRLCGLLLLRCFAPSSLPPSLSFRGTFWKAARIGERLSPWVSVACIAMGINILFFT